MRITAEFKDLNEFLAFVKAKGVDMVEIHDENGPMLEVATEPAETTETVKTVEAEALETPPQPAPAEEPTYSLAALQKAAADLLTQDKSIKPRLAEMLKECGVRAMRDLPTSAYASFAEGLRSLGAAV